MREVAQYYFARNIVMMGVPLSNLDNGLQPGFEQRQRPLRLHRRSLTDQLLPLAPSLLKHPFNSFMGH